LLAVPIKLFVRSYHWKEEKRARNNVKKRKRNNREVVGRSCYVHSHMNINNVSNSVSMNTILIVKADALKRKGRSSMYR
jgi:hypothetical protein